MNQQDLMRKVACLETREDHLVTELEYINDLLMQVGFERGVETLKAAAEAMLTYPELGML